MRWREFSSCSTLGNSSEGRGCAGKCSGLCPTFLSLEEGGDCQGLSLTLVMPLAAVTQTCSWYFLEIKAEFPKKSKGKKGLGAAGEPRKPWLSSAFRGGGCAEQWLEGDCRDLGLALLSLRLK